MDNVKDADIASGVEEPTLGPSAGEIDRATSISPTGIRSSPPLIATDAAEGRNFRDGSPVGPKSDSEAETVLLPGVNGHSPTKNRKAIKLEDKSADIRIVDGIPEVYDDLVDAGIPKEGAGSNLGKRKRSKHGQARHESARNGNSSGLSSIPSSPVATLRSSASKKAESDSELSKSPSPQTARSDDRKSINDGSPRAASREIVLSDDKERRGSGPESSNQQSKQKTELRSTSHVESNSRNSTRSTSPHLQIHRRSASSNSAANGLSHKKRKLPAPLRATRDRNLNGGQSDDESSVDESTRPRRSRTRNLATPPTGDSSHSLARMAPHKKRNPFGRTALADACEEGDLEKVKKFLAEKPSDLDVADAAGNTPLQCASLNGHDEVVKILLNAGCNIHCVNDSKDSPLLDAVENGHLEVVKLLLAAGVNPKIRNAEGEEPINKINEEDEDAEEIRQALLKARPNVKHEQPSAPVQSPHTESHNARSRRTQSHGRSTKTGEHQLYTSYNVQSLRSACARGDLETVGNILQVIVTPGFDDPESLVAAARGGHDEVLQILLGFGNADPDPPPLKNKHWEHATPILAAIGSDNIKVIELLLANVEDGRFDPTRRFAGHTYYEIAKQRMGPIWEEEERILKTAFENYRSRPNARGTVASQNPAPRGHQKRPSDSDGRSNGSRSRRHSVSGSTNADKREQKGATISSASPVKRGPGRPRKEGPEAPSSLNREATSSALHREKLPARKVEGSTTSQVPEAEPAKPRRKLISMKDLKGEREKQRRTSVASLPSASSMMGETNSGENTPAKAQATKSNPRIVSSGIDADTISEKSLDRTRSIKREESKDRVSVIRGESPAKRPRTSLTPPSELREANLLKAPEHGASHKRRRLENDSKPPIRAERRWSSSPDRRISSGQASLSTERVMAHADQAEVSKPTVDKVSNKDSESSTSRQANVHTRNHSSSDAPAKTPMERPSDNSREGTDNDNTSLQESGAIERRERRASWDRAMAKTDAVKVRRELQERGDEELEEKASLARQEAQLRKMEEGAKRKEEEARRKEEEDNLKVEEARRQQEEAKRLEEEARRQQEEAKRLEEEAKRQQQEDAKRQEQERQEFLRRAEEGRKRFYDEQVRIQREEQERRKAAQKAEQAAEQRRLHQEREAARLAKLPPLLRWFDGCQQAATPEIASEFRVMQGVRYDTIKSESTSGPDAREQWVMNTHVALLLGEKDLQLSRCKVP